MMRDHEKLFIFRDALRKRPPERGAGTELKALLAPFVSETPSCNCMTWVARMNQMGVAWCDEHVEDIAAQMVAEAQQRGWRLTAALLGAGAQVLVRTAIARAKSQS